MRPAAATRSIASRIFGYDLFISFALVGAERSTRAYASDLARRLRELDFTVFFSEEEAPVGDVLDSSLVYGLQRARALVVVINRGTLRDPRWVRTEVEEFRKRHPSRPVIPISIDGALGDPALAAGAADWLAHERRIWIEESAAAAQSGAASDAVVHRLATAPRAARSAVRLRRLVAATGALLLTIAATAVWQAVLADLHRNDALKGRSVAEDNAELARLTAIDAARHARSATSEAGLARAAEADALQQRDRALAELTRSVALRLGAEARELLARHGSRSDEAAWQFLVAADRLLQGQPADGRLQRDLLTQAFALRPLQHHLVLPQGAASMAFDPRGGQLLVGGVEGVVHRIDLATAAVHNAPVLPAGEAIVQLAFDPTGRRLFATGRAGVIAAFDPHTLARLAGPVRGHRGDFERLAVHPSGSELTVSLGGGAFQRLDANTLRPLGPTVPAHGLRITGLAYSAAGRRLATVGQDTAIRLWNTADGSTEGQIGKASGMPWTCVAVAPDDAHVATCGGDILDSRRPWPVAVWPMQAGAAVPERELEHRALTTAASYHPQSLWLATADAQGHIRLWNEAGRRIDLGQHHESVDVLSFSPDGRWLASLSADGNLRVWRTPPPPAADRPLLLTFAGPDSVVTARADGGLQRWRLSGGDVIPDSRLAATGDRPVLLQTSAGGNVLRVDEKGAVDRLLARTLARLQATPRLPHFGKRGVLAASGDGQELAYIDADGIVVRSDVISGKVLRSALRAADDDIVTLAFAPGGELLVGSSQGLLWRWPRGAAPSRHTAGSGWVHGGSPSPDGRWLALAGSTQPNIVDRRSLTPRRLDAPESVVALREVRYVDSDWLVADNGNALSLWHVDAATLTPMWPAGLSGPWAASPDGRRFATLDEAGRPALHALPASAADDLCGRLSRNMSRARWREQVSGELPYRCQCPGLPIADEVGRACRDVESPGMQPR